MTARIVASDWRPASKGQLSAALSGCIYRLASFLTVSLFTGTPSAASGLACPRPLKLIRTARHESVLKGSRRGHRLLKFPIPVNGKIPATRL